MVSSSLRARIMGENDDQGANTCCNEPQTAFAFLYLAYLAVVILTWGTLLVKPLRLLATFVHEMSHAIACWLTCGEVRGINVYDNEGGVTRYVGGCRCLIIPAGYLGEAFWGMVFTVLSGGRRTATFAAGGLVVALLFALCFSPNRTMVYLNLFYAVVTGAFIAVEWYVFSPILAFVVLLFGVFLSAYALGDIWAHLVERTVQGSDAYALYEESGRCCQPKCVGLQWFIVAIFFQLLGIWLALVLMSEECQDRGWTECVFSDEPFDFFDDLFGDFHFDANGWFDMHR